MFEVHVGDRVLTEHGKGTVKEFENFDSEGFAVYNESYVAGNRVCIELDSGHIWAWEDQTYCALIEELQLIWD